VLGAFKLLGRLSGTRLPLTSSGAHALDELLANSVRDQPEIDGMATLDGDTIRVLVWNYHDDLVTVPTTPIHLAVTVPSSLGARVRVSHLRVDELHGNAHTAWLAQGMPAKPSVAQFQSLQRAMEPQLLVPDETVLVSPSGLIEIDFDLPRFGVSLVTLRPSTDSGDGEAESDPGHGASSCACRVGNGGPAADRAAALGMNVIALLVLARRRQARALPRKLRRAIRGTCRVGRG
jgi:MYXO-CTERM domain-containing protein